MGIADCYERSPPQFTSTEHKNQGILNFGYVVWQYKDQTILDWIILSLSPAVASTIYGLRSLGLLGKSLVHVLFHPLHLIFLLSRESYNLYSKAPCNANNF